ncbi:MAG: hypothetical protein IPN42_02220 [Methylococcaceae bacterium]|nr:hypothetical protein [Methylococcaceae bacterium]
MSIAIFFEKLFKWLFLGCLSLMLILTFYKDKLPDPAFYGENYIEEPIQLETVREEFETQVNGEKYTITPLYDYELQGVVVSYHDADSFLDIWHHKRWRDFLNQRDLCVIWGDNLVSGVYKKLDFSNDSWTCWVYWPDSSTGSRFKMNGLSNNHLLIDNEELRSILMSSEPGDHVRFKGFLAEYANKANNFKRGSSTTREDSGNGACETVYLTKFEIIKKANVKVRRLFNFAKTLAFFSLIGFLVLFFITPARVT